MFIGFQLRAPRDCELLQDSGLGNEYLKKFATSKHREKDKSPKCLQ